jgi:hypothetical protein
MASPSTNHETTKTWTKGAWQMNARNRNLSHSCVFASGGDAMSILASSA